VDFWVFRWSVGTVIFLFFITESCLWLCLHRPTDQLEPGVVLETFSYTRNLFCACLWTCGKRAQGPMIQFGNVFERIWGTMQQCVCACPWGCGKGLRDPLARAETFLKRLDIQGFQFLQFHRFAQKVSGPHGPRRKWSQMISHTRNLVCACVWTCGRGPSDAGAQADFCMNRFYIRGTVLLHVHGRADKGP
jgi:hypothetical protein